MVLVAEPATQSPAVPGLNEPKGPRAAKLGEMAGMSELWCQNGCYELPPNGVCQTCGSDLPGVPESETLNVIGCTSYGHWYLRPRNQPIYAVAPDPREPDDSREGIFRSHNCWRCHDGKAPCVSGNQSQCEYPRARND